MYQLVRRASTAPTTCPTARTCATRAPRWRLPKASASGVGTVHAGRLRALTDLHLLLRPESRHERPRMLHELQHASAARRTIITFNPLRERGLERFTNPQNPLEMLTLSETQIAAQYLQVKSRRRHRGADRPVQGCDRARRRGAKRGGRRSACSTSRFIADTRAASRHSPPTAARRTGTRSNGTPASARRDRARRRDLRQSQRVPRHLRHGPHPARAGHPERADVRQSAAPARQYRQARREHLPGARPFERPGPAHRRHHRKPELAPLDQLARQYGFEPPRENGMNTRRRLRRRRWRRRVRGFHLPRRQLRPRDARPRPHGAGLAQAAADRFNRHQAQPQPSLSTARSPTSSRPRPHRNRQPGERAAGPIDGGLTWPSSTARAGRSNPASRNLLSRTGNRRGTREGHAAAKSESPVGRMGRRLRQSPRRHRRNLAGDLQGLNETLFSRAALKADPRAPAAMEDPTGRANSSPQSPGGRCPGHAQQRQDVLR